MKRPFFALALLGLLFVSCDREQDRHAQEPDSASEQAESSAAEEKPEESSLEAWHSARAQAFRSPEELAPVIAAAEGKRLILLGEASHGTKEFYELRARLSLAIAAEQGLDFVAIEADWTAVEPVDRYVRGEGQADDIDKVLQESFERWPQWMWANEEFAAFARQVRVFNEAHPERPIRLYGIDVQSPHESIEALKALISTHQPARANALRADLNCLGQFGEDRDGYARALHDSSRSHGHGHHGHAHHGHSHGEKAAPFGDDDSCEKATARVREQTFALFAGNENHEVAARKLARSVSAFEHQQRSRLVGRLGDYWNSRAVPMYEITAGLLEVFGDEGRGVVWAHNTHIGDARATRMTDQNQVNLGQLARERLGTDQVLAIGFTTFRGRVLAGSTWGANVENMEVPEAMEGSVDELFQRNALGDHFLFFEEADHQLPFFTTRPGQRAIGVVYDPTKERFGNYVATNPAARYDVLIFLEESDVLSPL